MITLYTRPGCSLCVQARRAIDRALWEARDRLRGVRVQVQEVDIAGDPDLLQRYGTRIPVVAVDGLERLEGKVSVLRLRRVLEEAVL